MISLGNDFEDFRLRLFENLRAVLESGPDVPDDLLLEIRKAFDLSDDAGVPEIINAIDAGEAMAKAAVARREEADRVDDSYVTESGQTMILRDGKWMVRHTSHRKRTIVPVDNEKGMR